MLSFPCLSRQHGPVTPGRPGFYWQLAETARHEDAPLAVATPITDFCIMIPLQVNASVVGRASIRETVDIRWAEGAAQRIDATKINLCCRPGNLDSNRAPESACPAYRARLR